MIESAVVMESVLFGLPMTAERSTDLIEFVLKCPSDAHSSSSFSSQLSDWLVLLCLTERLLTTEDQLKYFKLYFNVLLQGLTLINTKDELNHPQSIAQQDELLCGIFALFKSRYALIARGIWSPLSNSTAVGHLSSYREVGANVLGSLFCHPACDEQLRDLVRESVVRRMVIDGTDADVGHFTGSILVVKSIIIRMFDESIWLVDIYRSIIHSTEGMIDRIQHFIKTSNVTADVKDLLFILRCLPTSLAFINQFMANPPNGLPTPIEVILTGEITQNKTERLLQTIGYVAEQLMNSAILPTSGTNWQPFMRRGEPHGWSFYALQLSIFKYSSLLIFLDLQRQLWGVYGTLLGQLCIKQMKLNETFPGYLVSSIDHFLLTSSSNFDASESAFTGQAIVDLMRACLTPDQRSSNIVNLATEILDVILTLAVSPSLPSLGFTTLGPLQLSNLGQSNLGQSDLVQIAPAESMLSGLKQFLNESLITEGRSQTCVMWLVMMLRQEVADQLISKRLDKVQLALIR